MSYGDDAGRLEALAQELLAVPDGYDKERKMKGIASRIFFLGTAVGWEKAAAEQERLHPHKAGLDGMTAAERRNIRKES